MKFVCNWLNEQEKHWIREGYILLEYDIDSPETLTLFNEFKDSNKIELVSITQWSCDTDHENEEDNHFESEITVLKASLKLLNKELFK